MNLYPRVWGGGLDRNRDRREQSGGGVNGQRRRRGRRLGVGDGGGGGASARRGDQESEPEEHHGLQSEVKPESGEPEGDGGRAHLPVLVNDLHDLALVAAELGGPIVAHRAKESALDGSPSRILC